MEGGEGEPPPTSMGARPTRGRGRGRGQSAASAFITKFKVRKQTVQPSAGITSDAADIEAQAEALHARSSSSTTTTTPSATTPSTSSSAFSAPPSMAAAAAAARVVLGSQLPTAPKSFMGKATFKVAKRNGQPMSVPTQPPTSPPPTSSRRTSTTSAKRPHTSAKRPPAPSPSPSPSPSPPSPSSSTRSSLSSSTTLTSTFPFSSLASYSSSSVGLPAAPSPNSSSSSSSSPPSPLTTVSPARGFSSSSSHNGGRPPAYATSSFDSSALLSSPPPSTTSSSLSYGEFAYDEHVGQPLPRQNFAALLHGSPHPIGGGLMHRRSPPTSSAAEGGRKAKRKRKRKEESGGESEAASRREKERRGSTKAMDEVTEQSDDGPREEGTAMEGKRIVRDIHDRVEAEENEEEAEEEEEEGHEDEDEGESDKIGVWDSQARLSAETTALVLMAAYERYVFPFTPLHPLVMHEDSVRLCVSEGDDSASPLTINVNMALALACNVIGDVRRANQFYNRARQKVAPFFDTSDYTVAESLATMGYFAFGQGDMARVSYYVDLAASICREVGAYNSDTYTKCMLGTALDPMRSLEEKERTVADYHKKAALYPYFERDRLHILEAAPSCLGGVKGPAKVQCLILTRIAGRCLGDCMVILAEFESRKRMMATEGSEELKSWEREIERLKWLDEESRYPVPPFFDARRHRDFMSSMRKLEETLDKPELMGKSFGETAIAFHMVLRAKYALLLSKDKESFDWALRFVDVLQEINVRLMSPGNIPAFQLLLDILLEFQRPDLVKQCLESVDSWVRLYPFAQGIARVYAQLARDMESVMLLSFDTSSSSSSSSSPPSFSLRTAAITPSLPSPSQSALPSTSAPAAVVRGAAAVRGHERRRQRQQQQEGMRELQMEQERRRQELLQLEPSAVVAHCRPVYAVGPQPQPQPPPPPQPYADLALLGASAGTVTWPPMPTSMMRGPTSTTLEDEAERWLMQAEQDATAYAARGPPLPIHHHHQQIYAQQLRPPMIAAADRMMGLSMPLDIGTDGRTQQQPPPQMAAAAANSFMPTSPSSAVFYSSLVPLHPPHPPSPSALVHKTTSRRDNK